MFVWLLFWILFEWNSEIDHSFTVTVIKIYQLNSILSFKNTFVHFEFNCCYQIVLFCSWSGQLITQITLVEASGGSFSIYYNLASITSEIKKINPNKTSFQDWKLQILGILFDPRDPSTNYCDEFHSDLIMTIML